MSELLLGVDVGTSSSKGVLSSADGEVVATAERPHDLSMPRPGWAEHDAEEVWWADFVSICRELLGQADDIAAVCTSGIGACLLLAEEEGRPLRPAILYGTDTRAEHEIEELGERYEEETLLARCGSVLTTQAVGPKLLWLGRNEPEVWEKTNKFFMVNSFIAYRLTGEYVLDHHSAIQCDPLYDVHEYRWISEWAEEIAPGLSLQRLLWPAEVVGEVSREAAQATGIPAGTPVAAGTIDAWSEGASVGVQDLPEQTIGASYGDALLAARAIGLCEPETDWSTISETVEPKVENRGIYDELYAIYRDFCPATREASHALADMQKGGADVVT
jgi:xylulokinase